MIVLGNLLILCGFLFATIGVFALFRFPDFYTKLHASSVIESCAIPMICVGLAFLQETYLSSFKLVLIAFLIPILNPVATYSIAYASLSYKIDNEGRIR